MPRIFQREWSRSKQELTARTISNLWSLMIRGLRPESLSTRFANATLSVADTFAMLGIYVMPEIIVASMNKGRRYFGIIFNMKRFRRHGR